MTTKQTSDAEQTNPLPDHETLRRMIEADQRQRVEGFQAYLQEGLRRFRCELEGVPQYTDDGRTVAAVRIRALP